MSVNHTLATPIGLDKTIQRLQTKIYDLLTVRWSGNVEVYGRAYKNQKKDTGFVLEWWNAAKEDYEDVYFNDSSSDAVIFFIDSRTDVSEDRNAFLADVKLVVMCNLEKILPPIGNNKRRDEESHRDVMEAIRSANAITTTGIEKDMNDIFSGIDTKKIKFNNIHPLHCFAIPLRLSYYLTDKCD